MWCQRKFASPPIEFPLGKINSGQPCDTDTACGTATDSVAPIAESASRLDALGERAWGSRLRENPLLATWAGGVNLWLLRHMGFGLENPLGLLGATGGTTIAAMVLDRVLEASEKAKWQEFLDDKVRGFLRRWTP